jgi:hypothetical protein
MTVNDKPSENTITLRNDELPAKSTNSLRIDGTFSSYRRSRLEDRRCESGIGRRHQGQDRPNRPERRSSWPGIRGPVQTVIHTQWPETLDTIQKVEFLDDKGEIIDSGDCGAGSFGFGENLTSSKSWQIATDAKTSKARFLYCSRTEPVNLPCKRTFGLGL